MAAPRGMTNPVYTVGHSTRTIAEFVDLLGVGRVERVLDVRAMPRSRTNPQFNGDTLPATLAPRGIDYAHSPDLAGLRRRSDMIDTEVNAYWRNQSFHNYADYALSASFARALAALIDAGARQTCAIMCAEAVWWRCHRRIIADHLMHRGITVQHLMNDGRIQPAALTPAATTAANGDLVYPAPDTGPEWP